MSARSHEEVDSPFVSFTDALTGVLLIFLILVLVLALNQQSASRSAARQQIIVQDLQEQIAKLTLLHAELGTKVAGLQAEYDRTVIIIGEVGRERDQAQGELDVLQLNLGQGYAQLGAINENIKTKDQALAGLNNEIADAETKQGEMTKGLLALQTQVAAVTDIYEKIVDDVSTIKIELGALEKEREAKTGELEDISIAISTGNAEAKSLAEQIESLKIQIGELTSEKEKTFAGRNLLFDSIQETLEKDGITGVTIDRTNDSLVMEEGILFDTGSYEIKSVRALHEVVTTLERLLPCSTAGMRRPNNCDANVGKLTGVVIEGHADRQGAAASNMVLSARRALAVYDRIMASPSLALARPFGTDAGGSSLFDVAGYGENRPAIRTADNVKNSRNRRIAIRLVFMAE